MPANSVQVDIETGGVPVRERVSISRWVNEPYPAWDQILTAHDVSRLVRRPPWVLSSMAAVGQFPRKQRFRGKKIGWRKADILEWMTLSSRFWVSTTPESMLSCRRRGPDRSGQQALPHEYAASGASNDLSTVTPIAGVSP